MAFYKHHYNNEINKTTCPQSFLLLYVKRRLLILNNNAPTVLTCIIFKTKSQYKQTNVEGKIHGFASSVSRLEIEISTE